MWNSGIRELELKVRGRKSRVRYRASYAPLTIEQSLSSRAWSTLLFESEENSHALEVETSIRVAGEAIHTIEVLTKLLIEKLELVANGSRVDGAFRMVVQLRGQDGLRLQARHFGFVVSVPNEDLETARRQLFAIRTELNLQAGVWDMVVGLWEQNSGRSSFVVHRIGVGRAPSEVATTTRSRLPLRPSLSPREPSASTAVIARVPRGPRSSATAWAGD